MKTPSFVLAALLAAGCAAAPQQPAQAPGAASNEPAPPASEPKTAERKAPAPAKVPDPPSACAEFVSRAPQNCAAGDPRDRLAAAISDQNAGSRDTKLVCLEADSTFSVGLIRTLRADLGPEACADALATPLLESNAKLDPEVEHALRGLIVAGKLARMAAAPPELKAPFDKTQFLDFFAKDLKPWVIGQALAIEELSVEGSKLNGYGKAIAAVSAGLADLRFVDLVRSIPLPEEMKKDAEIQSVYYAALDEALEPRKTRGRDAALVGLRMYAQLGALHDDRVARARALLSKLYSGARVDALDGLLLPPLPAAKLDSTARKLAAGLPTYYSLKLLGDLDPSDKDTLRALLERGLPPPLRQKLDKAKLTPESAKLYARAMVESGQRYFRAADFRRAAEIIGQKPADDEARLFAALGRALETGPADVTELMAKGAPATGTGSVADLEALQKSKGKMSGLAAFDAAYVLELTPRRDDPKFWEDLGGRYDAAAKLLANPAEKKRATDYAGAARATAKALVPKS
ncbi:MAG TPA: hypothetical protein VM686_00645 [Polyangiaceae bacterium]|nr:hypothetical protein [Polyangiaceae bacterium]